MAFARCLFSDMPPSDVESRVHYIYNIVRLPKRTMAVNGRNGRGNGMLEWREFWENSVTKRDFRQYYVTTLFVSC